MSVRRTILDPLPHVRAQHVRAPFAPRTSLAVAGSFLLDWGSEVPHGPRLQNSAEMGRTTDLWGPSLYTLFHRHSHLLEAKAASCKTHIPLLSASVHFLSHTLWTALPSCQGGCWRSNTSFGGRAIPRAFTELFWPPHHSGVVQGTWPWSSPFPFVPLFVNNLFPIIRKPINEGLKNTS